MKVRRVLLLVLAIVLLFNCSCQKQPSSPSYGEGFEQPEPQRMAYHFGNASRVGDDIYFVLFGSANNGESVVASEYGVEDFETYVPCFDAVCNHEDRSKCCITTSYLSGGTRQIAAFLYDEEPALVIFNNVDTCFSRPYSNVKVNLVYEDFVIDPTSMWADIDTVLEVLTSSPERSKLLVYEDYLYYVEIANGVRTQYRISLEGGDSERVFEEDNIIIKTIINDRFYGIRYDIDPTSTSDIVDREDIYYFRSDMNYENVEPLPETLEFFALPSDDNFVAGGRAILDADENFIYMSRDNKVWAIPDSDIYAEPVLLSDMKDKIPYESSADIWQSSWYNDGVIYSVVNTGHCRRELLDYGGLPNKVGWYESSTLYSFDIRTGECSSLDISSQRYLITKILLADGEYVYAEGRYVHDDNRKIEGVTMRLTLDTMRYEVILPDRFLEYSAETVSE